MRHARHRGALIEKWKESLRSVLPITAIVIALGLLAVPAPSGAMLAFLAGAVLCFIVARRCIDPSPFRTPEGRIDPPGEAEGV